MTTDTYYVGGHGRRFYLSLLIPPFTSLHWVWFANDTAMESNFLPLFGCVARFDRVISLDIIPQHLLAHVCDRRKTKFKSAEDLLSGRSSVLHHKLLQSVTVKLS
jgi:hypothetical protein